MRYTRIVCGTDGLEHSERALRRAAAIARESGAELHVVHVDAPEAAGRTARVRGTAYLETLRAQRRELVRTQTRAVTADGEVMVIPHFVAQRKGSVTATIAALAEEIDADLIVVGSRGRGGLGATFRGSVARGLPDETTRPVLTLSRAGRGAARPTLGGRHDALADAPAEGLADAPTDGPTNPRPTTARRSPASDRRASRRRLREALHI